jgi:hypothetical protein
MAAASSLIRDRVGFIGAYAPYAILFTLDLWEEWRGQKATKSALLR